MIDSSQVVYKLKVDHEKVKEHIKELSLTLDPDELLSTMFNLRLQALLCCDYVYVPESYLEGFIRYGSVIE